jgi:predicted O-methyltransferase YrrM
MQNEHWKTIFGWFDFESTYDLAIDHLKDGDIAIELGTFLGKSTCYLAQRLKESGKKAKIYACDIFDGSIAPFIPKEYMKNFYDEFIENLKKQKVDDLVITFKEDSLNFVKNFEDNSVSFIYIDDDHREPHVSEEISSWYPKLKPDGIMAGHDFYAYPEIGNAVMKFAKEKKLNVLITQGSLSESWRFIK